MGPLHQLLQAYQASQGERPQFGPLMDLIPAPQHPAMNDKMIMPPDDVIAPPNYFPRLPNERQELSSLGRLMNLG